MTSVSGIPVLQRHVAGPRECASDALSPYPEQMQSRWMWGICSFIQQIVCERPLHARHGPLCWDCSSSAGKGGRDTSHKGKSTLQAVKELQRAKALDGAWER